MIQFFFIVLWRRFCCWVFNHDPRPVADCLDGIARVRCRRCRATAVEMWRP